MYVRKILLDSLQDVNIQLAVHLWRQAGLYTHLGGAKACRLFCPSHYFFGWQKVALFFAEIPAESTKAALLDADICKVDIPVYDVGDNVAHGLSPELVRHRHDKVHFKPS